MVYDADGNRVAKTVNGVTTQYLVDDLNPTGYPQVVEELAAAAVTRTYTYGLQRISQNQIIRTTMDAELLRLRRRRQRPPIDELRRRSHRHLRVRRLRQHVQQHRHHAQQLPLSRRTVRLRPRPLLPPRQILQPRTGRFMSRDLVLRMTIPMNPMKVISRTRTATT